MSEQEDKSADELHRRIAEWREVSDSKMSSQEVLLAIIAEVLMEIREAIHAECTDIYKMIDCVDDSVRGK